ncbi:MFS general substrate transporter [Laetiporus sulphureus 93-53]|uniref:MFS general substrate transporter n=1 Tax=Laetiporus sulphureus 93-53 TaxID=1314785 RepID=A0A165DBQ7_9APHY|nr:MFS general substrate transporter [Laetiporus sulphureus 93-53]KZT04502.1 MFS general substrate transporter [Laetiporus sulphureus 93-53]
MSTPEVASRKPSRASSESLSGAERRAEILRALHAENDAIRRASVLHESALDVDPSASYTSLELSPAPERIRRRSELARTRSFSSGSGGAAGEAIELAVLPSIQEHKPNKESVHVTGVSTGIGRGSHASIPKAGDLELAPSPYAGSLQYTDADSTTPVVTPAQQAAFKRNANIQFAALCYSFFLEGWNDGSTGPLLPRIERYYHIGFAIVSLLFVTNCIGFLSGAVLNVHLDQKLGLGKTLVLGAFVQLIGYAMMAPGGPFPVMCIAFIFTGFGISLQNAQANGYVGGLKENARVKFGFLHASYGLGALVSPLVATQFSTAQHWSFHYLISAGIAVTNFIALLVVFRLKNYDAVMAETGQAADEPGQSENLYHQIMRLKEVHYLAIFSLIYVGVEVSIGGWIVTFIEDERHGNASAGYISSGFFGGLMLGRLTLMWLNRKLGEKWVIIYYSLVVIGYALSARCLTQTNNIIHISLEITVWVVPSLVENAVAVAFVGLLMGPIYPILMNHSTSILPKFLLTGCLGYISGVGQAGSAVLPFVTGLLSSKFGIASLQPFIVSMMSTMILIWAVVPKVRRIE